MILQCCWRTDGRKADCCSWWKKEPPIISTVLQYAPEPRRVYDGGSIQIQINEQDESPRFSTVSDSSETNTEMARQRAESLIYSAFVDHLDETAIPVTPELSAHVTRALNDLITGTSLYDSIVAEFTRRESKQDLKQAKTLAKHIAVLSVTKAMKMQAL
eukprot:Protomagalhaensia_wolfi_Nauph_80__5824@NODE_731_length_2055_cov_187_883433_g546_i0_p2_GENE_NODE_731_length_2055_cov_187_883433_g546_i0NODE_731_length_2055_cov_187_883433_g546_i0_p2_ORF_typecomplete_len159_score30_18INTS5_C/PF14838_6/0_098DUF5619/PF18505_1/1_4e03DUF5619/PF18505_1/3_9e02DUF5619/PF18505_1/3_6_NODE_731_length_2055_cov_187_883433_g546_i015422018